MSEVCGDNQCPKGNVEAQLSSSFCSTATSSSAVKTFPVTLPELQQILTSPSYSSPSSPSSDDDFSVDSAEGACPSFKSYIVESELDERREAQYRQRRSGYTKDLKIGKLNAPVSQHREVVETPLTSKSHIDVWDTSSETLIIFDWDDTLCPTTHIWDDPRLKWNEVAPCFGQLEPSTQTQHLGLCGLSRCSDLLELHEKHQSAVIALLRLAASLGQVVIVTLAEVGWVTTSCRNFMPKVLGVLEELSIEVVYARHSLPSHQIKRAREDGNDLTKVLKTRAMSQIIKKFYGTGSSGRSWKNIVSIGDSAAERLALQDVVFRRVQRDSRGEPKECRCKVVKLLPEPSVERLTAEAEVLLNWLLAIVYQDDDLDIDFAEMDEDLDSPLPMRDREGRIVTM